MNEKTTIKIIQNKSKKNRFKRKKFLRNVFLINANGEDYFGKISPEILMLLNERVNKNNRPMTALRKKIVYFGGLKIDIENHSYRIYITQYFSVLSRGYLSAFTKEFSRTLFVSTFLVSFPLSFLLAWLFTRPIKKLQLAVKEMSDSLSDRNSLEALINRKDEFGDLARDFNAMADHLNEIMQSKTRLLSDVSHELKSPLARLQIALGLAGRQQSGSTPQALARIKLEADRMNQMISGLLEYSKLSTSDHQRNVQHFNLTELIEILVNDAKFECQQKQIEISTHLPDNLKIIAVKSMLLSCLENILRNAIRYANQSISIAGQIENLSKHTIIEICDDGCGVDEDKKDKIFEAFYRPETDRSRQSGGVGLGLSIARKVVEAHKGTITAENIQPHGLKITIMLPVSNEVISN